MLDAELATVDLNFGPQAKLSTDERELSKSKTLQLTLRATQEARDELAELKASSPFSASHRDSSVGVLSRVEFSPRDVIYENDPKS